MGRHSNLVSNDWRKIEGYLYDYQINDLGQIRKVNPDGSIIMLKPVKNKETGIYSTSLRVAKNKRKRVAVKYLMDEVFFGGYAKKNGLCITHKNGIQTDCSKYNLKFVKPSQLGKMYKNAEKRVVKVDKMGRMIEFYASCKEAAEKNFISPTAVYNRVNNKVKHPFNLDGYTYKFVEDWK